MRVNIGDWVEYKSPMGATFVAAVTEIQGNWVYLGKEHAMLGRFCHIDDIIEFTQFVTILNCSLLHYRLKKLEPQGEKERT